MEATLANLNDGVIITDEAGTVVRLNAAASRMLGATSEEAVGQPFVVASRDHDLAGLLSAAMATDGPRTATVAYGRDRRSWRRRRSRSPVVESGSASWCYET